MCGGIAGVTDREISNCLFNGKITTEDSPNAICYMDENINCYYNENCGGLSSRATSVTDDQLSSGEVAYLLNSDQSAINWYQNVDRVKRTMYRHLTQSIIQYIRIIMATQIYC